MADETKKKPAPKKEAKAEAAADKPAAEKAGGKAAGEAAPAKPKKAVALSGIAAGTTALCTVGRSGNYLHYRGYDILEIADRCEFEEIAHLLVHEKLPNRAEPPSLPKAPPARLWPVLLRRLPNCLRTNWPAKRS